MSKKRNHISKRNLKRAMFNWAWNKWESTGQAIPSIIEEIAQNYEGKVNEDDLAEVEERLQMMRFMYETEFKEGL